MTASRHPLVQHKTQRLRDRATPPAEFRRLVRDLSQLLFVEATASLPTEPDTVQTPLAECPGRRVGVRVGLVPILRAGLGMADAMSELWPDAVVWHLGLYRDHQTLEPVTYYDKLPAVPNVDAVFVVDPMLATGGSALAAIDRLKAWGVGDIRFVGLIASERGVAALREAHPDVPLTLGAIDPTLNEVGYIVPGLGDAGDRQFGTM